MKKKIFVRYFKKMFIGAVWGLMFSTQASASNDINALISYLQDVLNATVESVASYIYEFNGLLPKTVVVNLNRDEVERSAQDYAKALSFCQIYNALPRQKDVPEAPVPPEWEKIENAPNGANLRQFCQGLIARTPNRADPFVFKKDLSKLLASDTEESNSSLTYTMQKKTSIGASGDDVFNFENLVMPSLYDGKGYKNALDFVAFSSRFYEPFPVDPTKWSDALKSYADTREFINYQMAMRSYVASQSVALGNLYRMIADRAAQKKIRALGLKNEDGSLIESPMQYQDYLANRRTNSQEWYRTMNSASANTVSREMLFVLAEIQRSLNRLEKTNERMLATFSVMHLNALYISARPELNNLGESVKSLGQGDRQSSGVAVP